MSDKDGGSGGGTGTGTGTGGGAGRIFVCLVVGGLDETRREETRRELSSWAGGRLGDWGRSARIGARPHRG